MPVTFVQKLAKEMGYDLKDLESKWDKAKSIAEKEGKKEDWKYIMGIFKQMLKDSAKIKKEAININEVTTVANMLDTTVSDGPVYLQRNHISRTVKCNCLSKKFKATLDENGNPLWLCLGCHRTYERKLRNRGNIQ